MSLEIRSISLSFWQSSLWEYILNESKQAQEVTTFSYGSESILIEIRPIGLGMLGAFSLGVDMSLYSGNFIEKCMSFLDKRDVIFWQIEEYYSRGRTPQRVIYHTYGKHFLEPWTRILDITLSEEQLLANMHEKGRYNIRLAWKRGVTVSWVEPTMENIDIWMSLLFETTERDGFNQNSPSYYISFLRTLSDSDSGGLLFAYLDGRVIAAGIFVFYNMVGIYYYGASTSDPEVRKYMAPYLLQWEAIRESRNRGCTLFDFLGIAPPEDMEHPLMGVSGFKEKFGGKPIMIGSKEVIIINRKYYIFFKTVRFLKNFFQKFIGYIRNKFQKQKELS